LKEIEKCKEIAANYGQGMVVGWGGPWGGGIFSPSPDLGIKIFTPGPEDKFSYLAVHV